MEAIGQCFTGSMLWSLFVMAGLACAVFRLAGKMQDPRPVYAFIGAAIAYWCYTASQDAALNGGILPNSPTIEGDGQAAYAQHYNHVYRDAMTCAVVGTVAAALSALLHALRRGR